MMTRRTTRWFVLLGCVTLLALAAGCGTGTANGGSLPTLENPDWLTKAQQLAYGELKGEPLCRTQTAVFSKDGEPVFRKVDENGMPMAETKAEKKEREAALVAEAYGWSPEDVARFHPRFRKSWQSTGPKTERLWICTHAQWIEDYVVRAAAMFCPSKGMMSDSEKQKAARLECDSVLIRQLVPTCVEGGRVLDDEEFEEKIKDSFKGQAPSITKAEVKMLTEKSPTCAQVGCYVKKKDVAKFETAIADIKKVCGQDKP
jgi:hypothetical protein